MYSHEDSTVQQSLNICARRSLLAVSRYVNSLCQKRRIHIKTST